MLKTGSLKQVVLGEGAISDTIKELPGKAWEGVKSGGRYIRDKYYVWKGERDGKKYAHKVNYGDKFTNPAYKKAYEDSFNRHNHMFIADKQYRGLI